MLSRYNTVRALTVPMTQQPLRVDDLDYELPRELIATRPAEPRDSARLLIMYGNDNAIEHRHVRDLPDYLRAGDTLVFNRTAVMPARLVGRRVDTGGRVEGLFLEEVAHGQWLVMLRSNGRLRAGQRVQLLDTDGQPYESVLELVEPRPEGWLVNAGGSQSVATMLDRAGWTPLPPYILRARGEEKFRDALDRQWYQTTFADPRERRSVAAPTAGLHFTPELLARIEARGVRRIDVVLDIGLGTFKPITAETIDQHPMHAERFAVEPSVIEAIKQAHNPARGSGRIIAVGTTVVRTLESLPALLPDPTALSEPVIGRTELLISPPYRFKHVDGMLTNFHLPRSTLLALVGAMVGLDRIKAAYREAISQRYRFYSYGDAMLILP